MNGIVSWIRVALVAGGLLTASTRAEAQTATQHGGWKVSIAPLYLWASEMDGSMALGARTVPIFMDFGSAAKKLSAIFTFDGEVQKGRWGVFGDIGFVRLATDASFELGTNPPAVVSGRVELDNMIVEGGGSVHLTGDVAVIAGVRTYTFSPNLSLQGAGASLGAVDAGRTNVDGFGGVTYRPRLSPRWTFLSRGDIGAGESDVTWSGLVAFEYHVKPFAGILFGYRALGIDTGDTRAPAASPAGGGNALATRYQITHYGPVFAGTFHWGH